MNLKKFILTVALAVVGLKSFGCAAPAEPAGLSSSGTSTTEKTSSTDKSDGGTAVAQKAAVNFGGALVGDAAMQTTVKACLDTGKFYERKGTTPACTQLPLAQVGCQADTIGQSMSVKQKEDLDKILVDLPGFLLDQCLDCPIPSANANCEGAVDRKQTLPGMRLYYIKQTAQMYEIKTLYITK